MRYVFAFLLLAGRLAQAQCCPYVQPVQVLPANPTATDNIRLVFQATTPNRGQRLSTSFTRVGNTLISARKSPLFPSHFSSYGLGVFSSDYNGRQIYNHTGGADGFVTGVCFVPEERLGMAVLTNQDNQSFFEALRYQLLDAYLGVPYVDRSRQLWLRSRPGQADVEKAVIALNTRAAKKARLPRAASAYAGTYQNPLYGAITVEAKGKQLVAHFANHPALTATFDYLDGEQFRTTYSNPSYGLQPATFTVDNGQVKTLEIRVNEFIEQDPYLFVKQ